MPLAIPLADLRRQLQEQLVEDLSGALKHLKDLLPDSDKRDIVLNLLARLHDVQHTNLLDIVANDELRREFNAIRKGLLDLLRELADNDFDAEAVARAKAKIGSGPPTPKEGRVLYRIPHVMPMEEETKCVVRIAVEEADIRQRIVMDQHVVVEVLPRVSDCMYAEVADPSAGRVFCIRSTSDPIQLVEDRGYTEWFFYVEPLRPGNWPLDIKVAVIELVNGQERKKSFVFSETVEIVAEPQTALPETPFKTAGYALPFPTPASNTTATKAAEAYPPTPGSAGSVGTEEWSPSVPPSAEPPAPELPPAVFPTTRSSNKGLRALAVFLAFLVVGSTATYALTPADTLEWWQTRYLENTPQAYQQFIREHEQSKHRTKAVKVLKALEIKHLQELRTAPTSLNVRQFLLDFPSSERLSEIKQTLESHAELRDELLLVLENAYVEVVRQNTSEQTVNQFLMDFPESRRLGEVIQLVDKDPVLKRKILLNLKQAKMRGDTLRRSPLENKRKDLGSLKNGTSSGDSSALATSISQNAPAGQSIKSTMVFVKGGTFTMGDLFDEGEDNEKPMHQVTLSNFYMSKYEVTQRQWQQIMGSNPASFHCDDCPVENVNWEYIQIFLKKLNATLPAGQKPYRLPTEAEWEYAAREGDKKVRFGNGQDQADPTRINFNGLAKFKRAYSLAGTYRERTVAVGSLRSPNTLGLHDMSGNVSEWCSDWYNADYYKSSPASNPPGPPSGSYRVVRGGSWGNDPQYCRVAYRHSLTPVARGNIVGFRLAKTF